MSRYAAYLLLKRQARKKIRTVYAYGKHAEALLAINPQFEYPDWDYRTVGQFLQVYCSEYIKMERKADRAAKEQVMKDCGLVKVRGPVSGKIYWE